MEFKKVKKSFEFRSFDLKICKIYQNNLESCSPKYATWKVGVKELLEKRKTCLLPDGLKVKVRQTN